MPRKKRSLIIFLFIAIILVVTGVIYYQTTSTEPKEELITEPTTEYGIVIDSLLVYKKVIKPNQNLSEILSEHHIDYPTIDLLVKRAKDVFDVRRIKAGNDYTLICTNDSMQKALYFIYENSSVSYIVFDLRDSVHVHAEQREIEKRINATSGIVTSSLWNTMEENNTNPNLALMLSEIYACAIDFYAIQKNDKFRIIFEELYVEGKPIGVEKILGACFYHGDKNFYAFYFTQDSIGNYFDEEGKNLKKAFLKAPLKFSRISSRFSHSRLHPVLRIRRPHHGVDYAAPRGTSVHTIGNGIVIKAGWSGGGGRAVKIKHNGIYTTSYMHLSGYGKGMRAGAHVNQGDVIGYVGSSGLATGPHLDFRVYKNGQPVDPLKIESPPAEPVKKENMIQFKEVKNSLMKQLALIKVK